MKWLVAIPVIVVVGLLELWWGWWWRAMGVQIPVSSLVLFGLCLWLDRQWWPWLGLVLGVVADVFGLGLIGQYSLWWWLGMCGAWWLAGRIAVDNGWRWWLLAGYMALLAGLLPLYEAIWFSLSSGGVEWWPDLAWVSLLRVVMFLVIAWPLAWWLGRSRQEV